MPSHFAPVCLSQKFSLHVIDRQKLPFQAHFSGRSPASLSSKRVSCKAVAVLPEYDLEAWQYEKLQNAIKTGRKKISIQQLSREVELDRSDVLQWLKHFDSTPERVRSSLIEAKKASALAVEERKQLLSEAKQKPGRALAERTQQRDRIIGKGSEPHVPGSAPWAGNYAKKKLPRSVEATLEKVFEATPEPSQKVVASLWDLHKLSKRRVLGWFAARRRERGLDP